MVSDMTWHKYLEEASMEDERQRICTGRVLSYMGTVRQLCQLYLQRALRLYLPAFVAWTGSAVLQDEHKRVKSLRKVGRREPSKPSMVRVQNCTFTHLFDMALRVYRTTILCPFRLTILPFLRGPILISHPECSTAKMQETMEFVHLLFSEECAPIRHRRVPQTRRVQRGRKTR